jgi:L-iditol 2-dehydrogenase
MQALVKVKSGQGFVELQEIEKPTPGENEVLIRVRVAGICGTDLHIYEGGFPSNPPVVLGHEFSGEIVEVGRKVTHFRRGDRVVAEPHKGGCGICRFCLNGEVSLCAEKKATGYKWDGCFMPFVTMPAFSLHRIPENVSFEQAALSEPLAVVVRAMLERSTVEPEDFVVVLGCGPIGLLAAAVARAEGARSVLITGTNLDEKMRLSTARQMQIDHVLNVQKEEVIERVNRLTGGLGADLVVEASGAEPAIWQAFDLVRRNGRICGLGLTGKDKVSLPWDTAIKKAAQLKFSLSSSWTSWERALSMLSNRKVVVDPLITQTLPLTAWKEAFEILRRMEAIKILLVP